MQKMSAKDFRYPGSRMTANQIKSELEKTGFVFTGEFDEEGRKNVALPDGWRFEGDSSNESTYYQIHDDQGRHRLSSRRKIPWGEQAFISFVMVELPAFMNNMPPFSITSITQGWE